MPPSAATKVHRLSSFVIEEVSMVDRAANKRRFLQFKRDASEDNMPTTAIKPDSNGTFSTENAPASTPAAATPTVTKAMSDVEEVFFKVGDAVDRLMRVASVTLQADSLQLADGPNATTVVSEIEAVKAVLSEVSDKIADITKAAAVAATADADKPAVVTEPTAKVEVPDAVAELEALAASLAVTKSGASMSAPRLQRFTTALSDLAMILKEVGGDTEKLSKNEPPVLAPAESAPTPAPAAEATDEAAELRKQLVDAQRQVATLKREPATPTSLTVEGDAPPVSQDYAWPADMTKPLGRNDVEDRNSFY